MPDDIRIEYVNFEEIAEWPRNPKDHDLPAIQKSFKRFGFIKPVLLDETSQQLVAGHGRLDSLREIKKAGEAVPKGIKIADGAWLVPVLRGVEFENVAEAEAFLIADNRLSEVGGWNKDLLDEMLMEMVGVEGLLEGTGFTVEEVPDIHDLGDIPAVGSGVDKKILTCPKCGFEWQ